MGSEDLLEKKIGKKGASTFPHATRKIFSALKVQDLPSKKKYQSFLHMIGDITHLIHNRPISSLSQILYKHLFQIANPLNSLGENINEMPKKIK